MSIPARHPEPAQSVKAYKFTIRGYVKERPNGRFVGVSLRPNLVVEGQSQAEALHKMRQLIHAYAVDAAKDDNFEYLMGRRAPLRFYVEYFLGQPLRLLSALNHSFKSFRQTCNIPLHA